MGEGLESDFNNPGFQILSVSEIMEKPNNVSKDEIEDTKKTK